HRTRVRDRRDLNDIHARTRVEEQGRVRHLKGAPSAGSIRASTPRIIPGQEHLSLFIPPVKTKPHEIPRLGASLGMPPSQAAREQLSGSLSAGEQAAMEYMDKVAEASTPLNRLWPAGFDELRTLLSDLNEAIAFGDMSIPDAVEQFFTTADGFA